MVYHWLTFFNRNNELYYVQINPYLNLVKRQIFSFFYKKIIIILGMGILLKIDNCLQINNLRGEGGADMEHKFYKYF